MRGFSRRDEILAIYGNNHSIFRRERSTQGYPISKGRNKLIRTKSNSDSTNIKPQEHKSIEYESDAYDSRIPEEMKKKRYLVTASCPATQTDLTGLLQHVRDHDGEESIRHAGQDPYQPDRPARFRRTQSCPQAELSEEKSHADADDKIRRSTTTSSSTTIIRTKSASCQMRNRMKVCSMRTNIRQNILLKRSENINSKRVIGRNDQLQQMKHQIQSLMREGHEQKKMLSNLDYRTKEMIKINCLSDKYK